MNLDNLNQIKKYCSSGVKITLTSLVAALACTGIIYAATTVGTNISTTGTLGVIGISTLTGNTTMAGTLGVTGLTTLVNASSTLLSVSGIVYIGGANGLILTGGSITDVSGAISFGNENLTTTGTLNVTGLITLGNASTTLLSVTQNFYVNGISTLATTTISGDFRSSEEVRVNGLLRAIKYTDANGTLNKIKLFADSNVADYCVAATVGSFEWAEAQLSSGGKVELSCGTYIVNDGTGGDGCDFPTDDFGIEGEDRTCVLIQHTHANATDTTDHIFQFTGIDQYLRGVTVDGTDTDGDSTTGGANYLVQFVGATRPTIEDVEIKNAGTDCLINSTTAGLMATDLYVHGCFGNEDADKSSCLEVEDGSTDAFYSDIILDDCNVGIYPHVHSGNDVNTNINFENIIILDTNSKGGHIIHNSSDGSNAGTNTVNFSNIKIIGNSKASAIGTGSQQGYIFNFTDVEHTGGLGIQCTVGETATDAAPKECNFVGGGVRDITGMGLKIVGTATTAVNGTMTGFSGINSTEDMISIAGDTTGSIFSITNSSFSSCDTGDANTCLDIKGAINKISVTGSTIVGDIVFGAGGGAGRAYYSIVGNTITGNIDGSGSTSNIPVFTITGNAINSGWIDIGNNGNGTGIIANNTFIDTSQASATFGTTLVAISVDAPFTITGNHIEDYTIGGTEAYISYRGIHLEDDSHQSVVRGNTIKNLMNDSDGATIVAISVESDENIIDGNFIEDNQGTLSIDYGIKIEVGSDLNRVTNNYVHDTFVSWLYLQGSNNYIGYNTNVEDDSDGGRPVRFDTGASNVFEGNQFSANPTTISAPISTFAWLNNKDYNEVVVTTDIALPTNEKVALNCSATRTLTLADGTVEGETKHIRCTTAGDTCTLGVTTAQSAAGNSCVFTSTDHNIVVRWNGSAWVIISDEDGICL